MQKFETFLEDQLKDPAFKAEYDALESEFATAQAMIDAKKPAAKTKRSEQKEK